MHFIKRAAFRALAAPSTSFVRSAVPSSTPFAIRNQTAVISAFKRYNSTENKPAEQESKDEPTTVGSAIDAATHAATDAATHIKEVVSKKINSFANAGPEFSSPPRYQAEPNRSVYVGNLLFEATGAELEKEFSQFGKIISTRIAQDARGLSKGFGYVEFQDIDAATRAIEARNNTLFEGRRMIVNYMTVSSVNRVKNSPSKTLFIGNLAFEMTDADLNKLFRDIKNVIDVRVAIDRRTGQPRGFAHADFVDTKSAEDAMAVLQGKSVYDRALRVDFSASATKPAFGRGDGGARDGGRERRGAPVEEDRF